MFYSKILSPKYRVYLRGITYSVFFAFLLSLTSCYTVSEETITTEQMNYRKDYEVLGVITKDNSVINLEKYNVEYIQGAGKSKGTLWCVNKYNYSSNTFEIKLDSISKVRIENSKYDREKSTIVYAVVGVGSAIIIFTVIKVWSDNWFESNWMQ